MAFNMSVAAVVGFTVTAIMAGLVPILWRTGVGSEVMQRIAPMIGPWSSSLRLRIAEIPRTSPWPLR
jgi:Cu/Ag efflux pump CusA